MLYNPIGKAILRILERTGSSQSTLASRANVSETTVSRWVKGTRPRADQWEKIFQGLRCTQFDFEVELTRVQCDHCIRLARELGEPAPRFATSPVIRKIETVLELDLGRVAEKKRSPMRRLRDLIITVVSQCEPLLQEFEELYAGTVDEASD